jgi:hypothetical protein
MILLLGVDHLKLEIILGELVLFLNMLDSDEFLRLSILELLSSLSVFQMGVIVVNQRLEIPGTLSQLMHFLMTAGLVMQNVYNQVPFNSLAIVSRVL